MSRPAPLLLAVLLLAGCPHDEYEVSMALDGDGFTRTLAAKAVGDEKAREARTVDAGVLGRAGKAYAKRDVAADHRAATFGGRFDGATPGDVGGSGRVGVYRTSLGRFVEYVEQVRGTDDPAGEAARRLQAIDRLVGHLRAWAALEFPRDPELPRLDRFLDVDARRDLKNLALAVLAAPGLERLEPGGVSPGLRAAGLDAFARVVLQLNDRGWMTPAEVDLLQASESAFTKVDRGGGTAFQGLVRRVAIERAGLPAGGLGGRLVALATDAKRLEASLDRYLATTAEYRAACAGTPTDARCGRDVLLKDIEAALGGDVARFEDDRLRVSFAADVAPVETNGEWDAARGAVTWSARLPRAAETYHRLPVVLFARWTVPDRAAQERLFGKLALDGEPLARYCIWRASLSPDAARRWDALLAGPPATPEALRARLQDLRNRSPDAEADPAAREILWGARFLAEALPTAP